MKICPFISHMIGEDQTQILEIQDGPRDDRTAEGDGSVAVEAPATRKATASHLFCLKESCRFYRKKGAQCSFDAILEGVESNDDRKAAESAHKRTLSTVKKELDKFWEFQTKSVAELIAGFGESEEKQKEWIEKLETGIADRLAAVAPGDPEALSAEIERLHTAFREREAGAEDLSTAVSDMLLRFDEGITRLQEDTGSLAKRLEAIESSLPDMDGVAERIEKSLAKKKPDDNEDRYSDMVKRFESTEKQLTAWKEHLDSRIAEIASWGERIDEIGRQHVETAEILRASRASEDEPRMNDRKREARKLNNLGVTSFHNGELEIARDQFVEAVAIDDGFAECYNNLGLVYTELGESEEASEAFGRAIEINPDLHAAYSNLGYVFYKRGSYDQAIEMYNEALGRNAANSYAYTNLANAHFKKGNLDAARGAWEKALELDPTNTRAKRGIKQLDRK